MKKRTALFFLFLFIIFLTSSCSRCETKLYTEDGKCCTYVCDLKCPSGYKQGTCNCECEATSDTNIEDIFEEDIDVEPPVLPSP